MVCRRLANYRKVDPVSADRNLALRDCGPGGDSGYRCVAYAAFRDPEKAPLVRRLVAEVLSDPDAFPACFDLLKATDIEEAKAVRSQLFASYLSLPFFRSTNGLTVEFDEYVALLSTTNFFATPIELAIACRLLRVPLTVWSVYTDEVSHKRRVLIRFIFITFHCVSCRNVRFNVSMSFDCRQKDVCFDHPTDHGHFPKVYSALAHDAETAQEKQTMP